MFFHFYSHDSMDSLYDYIWDVTILEYLTCILLKTHPSQVMMLFMPVVMMLLYVFRDYVTFSTSYKFNDLIANWL